MKLKTVIIVILILINTKINILTQNKEEINNKIKSIISQKKYDYQVDVKKIKQKKESKYKNIIDKIFDILTKIFNFFKKIFILFWTTSPLFSVLIFAILFALFILFIIWTLKQIDLSIKYNKKLKTNIEFEEGHYNYLKEFDLAKQMISNKKLKEAISLLINSMWLFYYHNKILKYDKSKTNREYLNSLRDLNNFELIKKIIFKAEKAVYYKEFVDEKECEEILWNVSEVFSQ